jgi:hypothetical protein
MTQDELRKEIDDAANMLLPSEGGEPFTHREALLAYMLELAVQKSERRRAVERSKRVKLVHVRKRDGVIDARRAFWLKPKSEQRLYPCVVLPFGE